MNNFFELPLTDFSKLFASQLHININIREHYLQLIRSKSHFKSHFS